jgi:hypothetical protein
VINTNPAVLRSGTIWFQVNIGNTSNSGNVDLYDVGTLKYEFDLKSAESTINSVGVIPGSMTIKVNDNKPDGSSVYDALAGEVGIAPIGLPFAVTRNANMFIQRHGQTTPDRFPFQFQFTGLKTDTKSGMTSLTFLPPFQETENVKSFYPNVPESERVFRLQNTNYACKPMGDIIRKYINVYSAGSVIYDTGTDPKLAGSNGFHTSNMLNSGVYNNDIVYGFVNTRTINTSTWDNDPIRAKVVSAAAMEGAIFGSAFSVNFYVNRTRTDRNVALSNNDITELEITEGERQVNAVNVFINTQTYTSGFQAMPTAPKASSEFFGYTLGKQFVGLDLEAHAPQLNRGEFRLFGVTTTRVINADSVSLDLTTGFLAVAGASAYSQAFSAFQTISVPQRIQTTVLGIDKVKPYESIKFDTSVPARFRSSPAKHYRPSSLEYDFKQDTVRITAYEIFP